MAKLHALISTLCITLILAGCGTVTLKDGDSDYQSTNHMDHASSYNRDETEDDTEGDERSDTSMHSHTAHTTDELRVVTWNVEHLAYPIDKGCKPRTAAEITALKEYADSLKADIVGLQEVGSKEAVHLLFPAAEWEVVMSGRPDSESYECRQNGFTSTQQKVAFAVRKPIKVNSVSNITAVGLNRPGLRYGLAINVNTPKGPTDILNLHLKSGCFVDNYQRRDTEACDLIGKQIPVLQDWITRSENSGNPYMVIGDMNHRLSAPYNRMTRDLNGTADSLYIATRDIIGCHPWYPALIDHIIVGNMSHHAIKKSAQTFSFKDMDVEKMLSDHCAVSVDL